jgi:hypothetical protein
MAPTYEIKVLDLMDVDVQRAFLVLARQLGSVVRAKTWSYLILGGDDPILVDTGASDPTIVGRLGMTGYVEEGRGSMRSWSSTASPATTSAGSSTRTTTSTTRARTTASRRPP